MSTPYQGQSANITPPAAVNIASSTDATPIVVTTSGAHGILDGTEVDVTGHQVNVNANGVRRIGYISTTQFSLIGSTATGAGAGGATGTVQSIAPPALTLVDGSVPPTAGAFNGPTEFNADVAALLWQGIGTVKPVYILEDGATDDTGAPYATFTFGADSTWTQAAIPWTVFTGSGTTAPLHNGDVLLIDADVNYYYFPDATGAHTASLELGLFALLAEPGFAFSALTRIPTSARWLMPGITQVGAPQIAGSVRLSGALPITGYGQKFQITIQAQTPKRAYVLAQQLLLNGDWHIRATVLRPTAIPQ